MKVFEANSGKYVLNENTTGSDIGMPFYDSSSLTPGCFGGSLEVIMEPIPVYLEYLTVNPVNPKPDEAKEAEISREELIALFAESAEEDRNLAKLGVSHYADLLDEEEDLE